MINSKKQKAFTLVEIILFMGLFSILLFVMLDLFTVSLQIKTKAESVSSIHQDGRYILEKVMNDLNNSQFIISPALGNSSNTLQFVLYGSPRTYRLNNNNFEYIDDTGTHVLNSYDTQITQLSFSRYGNTNGRNTLSVNITLRSLITHNNTQDTASFQTTVGLK
jgi:type II secretory pathway pseudopilin PulG